MTRLIDSGVVPEASRCWMIIDFTTSALGSVSTHSNLCFELLSGREGSMSNLPWQRPSQTVRTCDCGWQFPPSWTRWLALNNVVLRFCMASLLFL
jgi:hypothetical protein